MDFKHVSQEEREQLYEEVWAEPLTTVAKRYDMSDNGLRKHCKRLGIPLPGLGYWARIRSGQNISRPSLPDVQGDLRRYVHSYAIKYRSNIDQLSDKELKSSEPLNLLTEDTVEFLHHTCEAVAVKNKLHNPSELITKHKEESKYRRKRDKALQQAKFNINIYNLTKSEYRNNEAMLPINVSDINLNRAYRVMDVLIKTLASLEGSTHVGISDGHDRAAFIVMRTYFDFEVLENKRRKSKAENGKPPLLVLTLKAKNYFYGSIQEVLEFKDGDNLALESQVGDIILDMFKTANNMRIHEILNEREEKKEEAERERQRKIELMRQGELKEVEILTQAAYDWEKAQKIRAFASDMENKISTLTDKRKKEMLQNWLSWAQDKADWLDPLTEKEDELLGESVHIFNRIIKTGLDG